MMIYIPLGSALIGLVLTVWLIYDIRREAKKPEPRIDPEWRMDADREQLKALAIWKGYRK